MVAPYLASPTEVLRPLGEFATATVRVTDYDAADAGGSAGIFKVSTPAGEELTAELDGATEWFGLPADEILVAALSRTIARTLGEGVARVDIASERGSLLDAVPLVCVTGQHGTATEVLASVHQTLAAASEREVAASPEVYFNYIGELPSDTVPVQETPPGLGHALEVRVYRAGGEVRVDWWYDTSRFEQYTVEELSEQFPLALVEMTSDALPPN
ncbi:hypothetical protein AU184_05855 [Mycolicibacterium novocastrense]|uniref:hypothetical protein n=1 Tax=Mycolicibacterium novocastrense TaxID=59813 RepID=UPI0007470AB3|nr:hypothetical protein [Mycolicibacterium novocastrense]KUH65697.1 hypothetical protein AU072_06590 [Mycolicibacterium novocastrense]KUH65883.1 hypothetical protein AU183_14735 [Mycolicibacterium novocastrense]KUH67089.1 hypothetical protein AU184_05855 [Mycolicibacterium novocastrense]